MNESVTLDRLKVGMRGRVAKIEHTGPMKRRLLDIGLIPGSVLVCVLESPWGDPAAYLIRGASIAIRKEDAKKIIIEVLP